MPRLDVLAGQAGRYLLTGGAAAVVDAGGFWVLMHLGAAAFPAAVASFALALVVNYTLSSIFAFGQALSLSRFLVFAAFALLGLVVNVSVTLLAIRLLPIPPVLGKIIGIGVAFVANFLMNAFWVFRDRRA